MFQPGSRPRLTQSIPCWAASSAKYCRVCILSPLMEPELVNPAASLSLQARVIHRLLVASANAWKDPEAVPM